MPRPQIRMPVEERFWSKVWKRAPHYCWHWMASTSAYGYGQFRLSGRTLLAHRVSYKLTHGTLRSDQIVCHKCDTPSCVNPNHLWLGSLGDNNADRHAKGRSSGGAQAGSRNPMARLTDDEAREIAESTGPLKEVAAKYGIPFQTVSGIRRGRLWSAATGRRFDPWIVDGLGPQERQALAYIEQRTSSGPAAISDTQMAADLGFLGNRPAAYAKQRLARRGLIRKVRRGLWERTA